MMRLSNKGININNIPNVKIVPYIYNMQELMNYVDLVVSRSGAMTITEVALLNKPAIFIPFPYATENHQEYNARVLENVCAAKIILDKNLTGSSLDQNIYSIISNPELLKKMGQNTTKVSVNDVEEKIYEEIIKILKQ